MTHRHSEKPTSPYFTIVLVGTVIFPWAASVIVQVVFEGKKKKQAVSWKLERGFLWNLEEATATGWRVGGKGSFVLAGYTWNTNWSFNCPNFASQRPAPNPVVPVLKRKDTLTSGDHTARSSAVAAKTRNSPVAMFTALNTSCDSRASFWSVDLAGA